MALDSVLAFTVIAALLVAAPGPDWAFTLGIVARGQSLPAAVLGLVLGYLGMTVAVATGLGLVVTRVPTLLTILTLLGSAYLLWLGWRTLRSPRTSPVDPAIPPPSTIPHRSPVITGIGVSGLNPKALLIFVALLPQFVRTDHGWPVSVQLAALGLIFTALVGVFYPLLGSVIRAVVLRSARTAVLVTRSAGVVMIILGVALGWEHLASMR